MPVSRNDRCDGSSGIRSADASPSPSDASASLVCRRVLGLHRVVAQVLVTHDAQAGIERLDVGSALVVVRDVDLDLDVDRRRRLAVARLQQPEVVDEPAGHPAYQRLGGVGVAERVIERLDLRHEVGLDARS